MPLVRVSIRQQWLALRSRHGLLRHLELTGQSTNPNGQASQALVAALGGGSTLLCNVVVAGSGCFYNKDQIYFTDVCGVAFIIAGAVHIATLHRLLLLMASAAPPVVADAPVVADVAVV